MKRRLVEFTSKFVNLLQLAKQGQLENIKSLEEQKALEMIL
jgi:hypothetical protein